VLRHARALSALLNPTINSYKRFGPDTLAPWLIDWGLDNRSAMVRIPPERGPGARMEVRLGDATANPYLAMAAIGAAVYLGIQDKVEPPPKLEGYGYDAARRRCCRCGWPTPWTRWQRTASSLACSAATSSTRS
jgi:glutamine synthetase